MVIYHYIIYILHMSKLEKLHMEIQKKGVVTSDELADLAVNVLEIEGHGYQYLFTEYISKLLNRGLIVRPRRGIYVATRPYGFRGEHSTADRHVIASKIRDPYYLGFHTALEVHGCAYSWFQTVTVCLPHGRQFRTFEFQGIRYRAVSTTYPELGIESLSKEGHQLVISNPSRTFVDCLDRPRLAGGWEEVLKSLFSLPGVKSDDLLSILATFDSKVLYRKTGLVLGLLGSSFYYAGVLEDIQGVLSERTRGQPLYMDRNDPGPLNEDWNIYEVPNLNRMLEGV
jgi:predicted transcriptional regulator of viral defense system